MAKINNAGMVLLRKLGPSEWWGNGHWHHPWIVRNVLCEDGKRRSVYLGSDADTYFSWPGRVKIKGKWAKGFVTTKTYSDSSEDCDTIFSQYTGE